MFVSFIRNTMLLKYSKKYQVVSNDAKLLHQHLLFSLNSQKKMIIDEKLFARLCVLFSTFALNLCL